MQEKKIIIMGAAGKDFHVFNTTYRGRSDVRVVAFTAAQIPNIDGRVYPASLAGPGYPDGIPIKPEAELPLLIREHRVNEVIFAYSDVSYDYVAERSRIVRTAGAEFKTFDVEPTLLPSRKPVVSIVAVRTGAGKSPATRRVYSILRARGKRIAVIRHPMPYGDLAKQRVQRFATPADLDRHECTVEEREEYEPHIECGAVVYAGVDYADIMAEAEKEADIILWDGGNNDTPHYRSDVYITIVDPLRAGNELSYFPGRINFEKADTLIINKCDQASEENIATVMRNIKKYNPDATVIRAASPIHVANPSAIKGKRVLVVEDGPTLTHGGMRFGAGVLAAQQCGAAEMIDPRPFLVGSMKNVFKTYPHIGALLPAIGYGKDQMADLEATINATNADCVIIATPADLSRLLHISLPHIRVTYELQELGSPTLEDVLKHL